MHGTEYDATQNFIALHQLTYIDWTALAKDNIGRDPRVYYNTEACKASTPRFVTVLYRIQPAINTLTASQFSND